MTANVIVKESKRGGRGVFARKAIPKGTLFLQDPIIYVTEKDCPNYIYADHDKIFIGCGPSSLINHSELHENVYWVSDFFTNEKLPVIKFYALRDIKAGEELLHNYQWDSKYKGFIE